MIAPTRLMLGRDSRAAPASYTGHDPRTAPADRQPGPGAGRRLLGGDAARPLLSAWRAVRRGGTGHVQPIPVGRATGRAGPRRDAGRPASRPAQPGSGRP